MNQFLLFFYYIEMPSLKPRKSSNRSKKLNHKQRAQSLTKKKLNPMLENLKHKQRAQSLTKKKLNPMLENLKHKQRAQSLTKKNLKTMLENIFSNNQIQKLLGEINESKNEIMKLKKEIKDIKSNKLTKYSNDPKPASIFGISSNTFGSFNKILKLDEDEEIIQIREQIKKEKDSIRKKREMVGIIIDEKLNYVKPTSRKEIKRVPVQYPANHTTVNIKVADLPQFRKTVAF